MNKKFISTLFLLACSFGHLSNVLACPDIQGFVDYNCDGQIKVTFTGDSITYGRGDYINDDQGGFVRRLDDQYPEENVSFKNLGVPGFRTIDLLRAFKQNLNKDDNGKTKRRIRNTDAIIIKVGVNDWWIKDWTPTKTITILKRLIKFLRRKVPTLSTRDPALAKKEKMPFIAVSTLIPAIRESQMEFVNGVNAELLKMNSDALPVYIHSENFPAELIDESTVHPTPEGYDLLCKVMKKFLKKQMKPIMRQKNLLSDKDKDGVYDFYEKNLFFTSPLKKDTDADGYPDKQEIFILNTDPLDPLDPAPITDDGNSNIE